MEYLKEEVSMKETLKVACSHCNKEQEIQVVPEDLYAWQDGELIQKALPYLTPAEREMLISQTCVPCFDLLFGLEDDND
jgi:hypothetical protein